MTRDNRGFLGALMIFGLLIVGVWFVRRTDLAKPNPDPTVEPRQSPISDIPSQGASRDIDQSTKPAGGSGEANEVQVSYSALQDRFQRDVDRATALSKQDMELSGPIDAARQNLELLKASNATDDQIKAELVPNLLRLRAAAMKKHDIDISVIAALDDAELAANEKRRLLSQSPEDSSQSEQQGRQALINWRQQTKTSLSSSDEFLAKTNGLAEALSQ
jgi:hypothetical protein